MGNSLRFKPDSWEIDRNSPPGQTAAARFAAERARASAINQAARVKAANAANAAAAAPAAAAPPAAAVSESAKPSTTSNPTQSTAQNTAKVNETVAAGETTANDIGGNRQSTGTAIANFDGPSDIWTKSEPPIAFPNYLIGPGSLKFPFVGFIARKGDIGERAIFLPVPPGISFSDQMQYSSIDLGIIGNVAAAATKAATNLAGRLTAAGAGAGIGAMAGTLMNQAKSTNAAAIASLASKMAGFDNVSNFIDFGSKQVVAPNTNTAFQNTGIRQFQFSFKMMPHDRSEANKITKIIKRFRENMYPMGNDLILTYPPIWNIYFYDVAQTELLGADARQLKKGVVGGGAGENTKLPGIHDCYLIAMSTVYNSGSNMFHEDGHPIETDIQLTFEETRALTLADISKYAEGRTANT